MIWRRSDFRALHLGYSSNPWRVVHVPSCTEVWFETKKFDHPDSGLIRMELRDADVNVLSRKLLNLGLVGEQQTTDRNTPGQVGVVEANAAIKASRSRRELIPVGVVARAP